MDSNRLQNPLRSYGPLLTAGLVLFGIFTWISRLPNVLTCIHTYLAAFGDAFAIYLLLLRWVRRTGDHPRQILPILVFAALFRIVFIPVWPTLSTDFHRYVWDGRVQNAGINPYRYCPGSPRLAHLRNAGWNRINYTGNPTPYPPGAQLIFTGAYKLLPESQLPLKTIFVIVDLLTCLLILRILASAGLPRSAVIIYAWNPLVITELIGSGHVDVLAILAMTLALAIATSKPTRNTLALVGLGLSVMMKPLSAPLLPLFLRRHGVKSAAGFIAVIAALTIPYVWGGNRVSASILIMAKGTRKNTGLFGVFDYLASFITPHHDKIAVALGATAVAIIVLLASTRNQSNSRLFLGSAMAIMGTILIVSPVVYPWYVTWIVPFLCFVLSPGWLLFTGLVMISYLLPFYDQALWIKLIEYAPFYGLLIFSAFRRRHEKKVE